MAEPYASIVITVFNQKPFIEQAIKSALEQTYANLQIIVVDDGSTDGSDELIEKKFGSNITFIRQENQGPSSSLNTGIKQADGNFIAIMAGDDVSEPDRITKQINNLISTDSDITCSYPYLINKFGDILPDNSFPVFFAPFDDVNDPVFLFKKLFYSGNFVCAPSIMFKKDVIKKNNLFHESLIYLNDYFYWLTAASKGIKFNFSKDRIVKYRIHDTNLSSGKNTELMLMEFPFILMQTLNNGLPYLLRQSFSDLTVPALDINRPLTDFEKMLILMSHGLKRVRNHALTMFLENIDTNESFINAKLNGFDQFHFLYNNLKN